MPGFMVNGQGRGPRATAEVRRTHRWIFQTLGKDLEKNVRLVLKSASRPSISFEEPSMHHIQEQVYFAGKHTFEPLDLSWYDVEQDPDVSKAMFEWLEKCLTLTGGNAMNIEPPDRYKAGESKLQMIDGKGSATETWAIYNGWPQSINWGALDYTSSDLQLIEVKYRYDRAARI